MNFKFIIILLIFVGCGVKNDPISPKTNSMPSVMDNYEDIKLDKPLQDAKRINK